MRVERSAPAPGDLVVFGAWNYGRVFAEIAEDCGWNVVGFVDPEPPPGTESLRAVPEGASVIAAIGDMALRDFACRRLVESGRTLATLIHSSACVSRSASLGPGSFVGECAVVRANAIVGRGVILNSGSVVSHDCRVGDCVTLGPNAATSGHVAIGERTMLGVGACVRPGTTIGRDCLVGAGAAVVKDLGDGVTAVGNPARPVLRKPEGGKQSDWRSNSVW